MKLNEYNETEPDIQKQLGKYYTGYQTDWSLLQEALNAADECEKYVNDYGVNDSIIVLFNLEHLSRKAIRIGKNTISEWIESNDLDLLIDDIRFAGAHTFKYLVDKATCKKGALEDVEQVVTSIEEFVAADFSTIVTNNATSVIRDNISIRELTDYLAQYENLLGEISAYDLENENRKRMVSEKYKRYYLSNDTGTMKQEKAYGCTLIAFVVTNDYSFGLQIGDGKCVFVDQYGDCFEPIPWDDRCQMNVTTSICDSDAIDEFRFCVLDQFPVAVFCGSDGVDDSYTGFAELAELYRSILKVFVENGAEEGVKELQEYLPVLTKKGSGDDLSVAYIIDMQNLKLIEPINNLHIQLFTANLHLKEKQASYELERYKKEALVGKLKEHLRKEENILSVAEEIDIIVESQNQLKKEIQQVEQEISSLNRQIESCVNERKILLTTSTDSEKKDLDCTENANNKSEDQYLNADGDEEYSVPDDPITAKLLEDGSFLKRAIAICNRNRTQFNLKKLARILRDSWVWVPCTAILSDSDQEKLTKLVMDAQEKGNLSSLAGQELTSQDNIYMVPDILQNGEEFFFPVFTTAEEMGEYGDNFSKIERHFLEAANLAKNNEKNVTGIVINAFSESFVIPKEKFEAIACMDSSLNQEVAEQENNGL